MTERIRLLTHLEHLAIEQAKNLRRTLEMLRDKPVGSRGDVECISDALDAIRQLVQRPLDELGLSESTCRACGTLIPLGQEFCNACKSTGAEAALQ